MTDQIEDENKIKEEHSEQDIKPKPPTMATDTVYQIQEQTSKLERTNISFSIWPPTQRTRDAVIDRLIETLSSESVLSKRYGTIPHEEAGEAARRIEDEAFAAASASVKGDDDGIEILQVYSKEISKRMLAAVKSRSASASAGENDGSAQSTDEAAVAATTSEEISSVQNES